MSPVHPAPRFPYEPPPPQPICDAETPPDRLDQHEVLRVAQAANRAKALYPGVVGEVLASELDAARDMKFRLHRGSRLARLVNHLMTAPLPRPAA